MLVIVYSYPHTPAKNVTDLRIDDTKEAQSSAIMTVCNATHFEQRRKTHVSKVRDTFKKTKQNKKKKKKNGK